MTKMKTADWLTVCCFLKYAAGLLIKVDSLTSEACGRRDLLADNPTLEACERHDPLADSLTWEGGGRRCPQACNQTSAACGMSDQLWMRYQP